MTHSSRAILFGLGTCTFFPSGVCRFLLLVLLFGALGLPFGPGPAPEVEVLFALAIVEKIKAGQLR